MRFDWYQATIEDNPAVVIATLQKLGHEVRQADGIAKAYRYKQGWEIHHNERGVVAKVFAGGNGDKPHALSSSDETDAFVDLVRNEWEGKHLVTRMDAAQDFNEAGAYRRLRRVARKVAKDHRMSFSAIGDELNQTAGRTQYIGSRKSDYLGRLYEKGYEVAAKLKAQCPWGIINTVTNVSTGEEVAPADWVRLELQARPQGEEARRLAAVCTPEQAWTFTDWTQHLAREALALELERFYVRTRKTSKDEEALRWMAQQYGGMLSRLQNDLGDWACVGLEIGRIIKDQERA
jgi:hypothetical protein